MPLAFFHVLDGSNKPIDPGYGNEGGGGRPSHPIALPPLPPNMPSHPIVLPPAHPDQGLPGGGGAGSIGGTPEQPIYNPDAPDNTLPPETIEVPGTPSHPITMPPGTVWPPLPPSFAQGKHLVLVAVSGVGLRWVVIDTSLKPDQGLPSGSGHPDQGLPATPQPKR